MAVLVNELFVIAARHIVRILSEATS